MDVVGVRAEQDGEVAASRVAYDSDALWVDVPLGCVGTGEAHGLLRVFEIGRGSGIMAGFAFGLRDAVFDEQAGYADVGKPVAGIDTFTFPGKTDVAAAREDESSDVGVTRGVVESRR